MAYCMSCGAYIPDGQTKCLACGYDEAAKGREQKKKSDSYAYDVQDENLKEKLEQQRRQPVAGGPGQVHRRRPLRQL